MSTGTRQPWLFAAVLFALAAALATGLLARGWYVQQAQVAPGPTDQPGPSPSGTALPGSPQVQMSADAIAHPYGERVRQALQLYFDGINSGSYPTWLQAVTVERAKDKPPAQWRHEYGTTKDGSIEVYRIERVGAGELRALVGFVSRQQLRDAPPDFPHTCIRWRVVLPLTVENGQWRLDAGQTGASPQHDVC